MCFLTANDAVLQIRAVFIVGKFAEVIVSEDATSLLGHCAFWNVGLDDAREWSSTSTG